MSGIPFDKPIVRIKRLDEALTIISSMWTQDKTTYIGKHYQVRDMEKAGELPAGEHPKIMVGGGGKRRARALLVNATEDLVIQSPVWATGV